jgi:hypothetical protein
VAQTKRKRRTKHRGNAAGVVEARGRTGRKPTAAEIKKDAKVTARERRLERLDRPPSWRSATNRALIATLVLFVVSIAILRMPAARAAALMPFILVMYIPLGYYTDLFMYRRRQRSKEKART